MTCPVCFSKYSQATYCVQAQSTEYCCSPFDNSTKCNTNTANKVVCTPKKTVAGVLLNSYCLGAANPTTCGVDSLELEATDSSKTVAVANLPY